MRRGAVQPLGPAPILLAVLAGLAGCAADPPVREVELSLGREAEVRMLVGGVERDYERREGFYRFPLVPGRQTLEVSEPRKPLVSCELDVLVDPDPTIEDPLHFRSSANTIVVKTRTEGTAGAYDRDDLVLDADPLACLRDEHGGPWFLPAEGEGLIVAMDRPGALVKVGKESATIRRAIPPMREGAPLPARPRAVPVVFALVPGEQVLVSVTREGFLPFEHTYTCREGVYDLLCVRLAKEPGE